MHRISFLPVLFATLLLMTAASFAGNRQTYQDRYDAALALYDQGQLSSSIQQFRALVTEDPGNSLADNAQYWIGEAYFRLQRYQQAIIEFDRTLTYCDTNKREDSLYKLASCEERLGRPEQAKELYTRLLAEFPASRHAPYVLKKLDLLGS